MKSAFNISRVIIGIALVSLVIQIVASVVLIPKLDEPVKLDYLLLAIGLEFCAFAILAPFTKLFYATQNVSFSYRKAFALLLSSESLSRLVPFGDFFVHRYYFSRHRLPQSAPLHYITILYSFALLSLIILFLSLQVVVFIFFPSEISTSFAGKFALIPLTITGAILAIFLLRRSPRVLATLQKYSKRHLGSTVDSPFAIMQFSSRPFLQNALIIAPLALTWIIEGLAYIACLRAFGVDVPLLLGLYAYTFVKMFRFIPIFPGGVGEIEATSALLFSAYGYAIAPVITGSILFRFVSYWFPILLGVIAARYSFRR